MEKSDLEKALEQVSSYKHLMEHLFDGPEAAEQGYDFPDIYKKLRTVEKAYEQLQKAGVDVKEQLRERRYQIAELVGNRISTDVDQLVVFIQERIKEGEPGEEGGDVVNWYQTAAGNMDKLGEYLGKIYSGSFDPKNTEKIEKLYYPEPE